MKLLTCIILNFICANAFSQIFVGQVLDTENRPVSYVNIGILDKNTGTVSDSIGKFRIDLSSSQNNDILRFSCIGYETIDFRVDNFKDKNKTIKNVTINLMPRIYEVPEILVKSTKYKILTLGNPIRKTENRIRSDSELGSEIGLIIRPPRKNTVYHLRGFNFSLADHNFETTARINIYNLDNNRLPKDIILRKPIYLEIPSDKSIITVDLSEYDIKVKDDFFISLEHYKETEEPQNRLKFYGILKLLKGKKTDCLMRTTSQGDWKYLENVEVQFNIESVIYK